MPDSSRISVIQTLVGGAPMPPAKKLPAAIAGLVQQNGVVLNDADWARSMQFLFEKLQRVIQESRKPQPLLDLHNTLENMQSQYFNLMTADPTYAKDVARKALQLLDEQMPAYPQDHYLQMYREYFLKNQAMSSRDLGDHDAFQKLLQESEQTFQTIKSEAELYLANAYNGLGSVALLKGEGKPALRWIDKALELVPDHPYALHDREEALRFLKHSKPSS
jgi:tetratricopeptide (TPR) repeat protein